MHQPDQLGRGFPPGGWEEPAERLEELYQSVEEGALHVVEWYLADRARKRRGARLLRLVALAAGTAGALLPLLELAGALPGTSGQGGSTGSGAHASYAAYAGYAALLCAAACVAADRWLGLTSGWMRDMAAAQAVHRRLEALRYDWAAENVREVLGPAEGTAGEAAERQLAVLRRFAEDISEIVRSETADWMAEFRTASSPLQLHTARRGRTALTPSPPSSARRLPPPPTPGGGRANMPRQRPPGV